MKDVRDDFPGLTYLDSACTALKPKQVIRAEMSYYEDLGACGGRSSHRLGRAVSEKAEEARENVARFVGAKGEELVWTRNATEALNIVARGLDYSRRRKVVTTVMEHHSVLLPFMRLRDKGVIELEVLGCDGEGRVPEKSWEAVGRGTALIVTHSWNNTTGTGQDISRLSKLAHDNGALICVDGAQGVPHHKTDFRKEGIDFLCFSGHKMLGPSGIGALVARKEAMGGLEPLLGGGGSVKTVSLDKVVPLEGGERFEAGVQHYSGMIGLSAACDYLEGLGMESVIGHESRLAAEMENALSGMKVYGPRGGAHGALYSFNLEGAKPHELALMLDKEGIALRSGFFCAQPGMEAIGAKDGAVRASAYVYNGSEDIRKLGEALGKLRALY
jgi:cysteine desulfurase/selenocysteine lyase